MLDGLPEMLFDILLILLIIVAFFFLCGSFAFLAGKLS